MLKGNNLSRFRSLYDGVGGSWRIGSKKLFMPCRPPTSHGNTPFRTTFRHPFHPANIARTLLSTWILLAYEVPYVLRLIQSYVVFLQHQMHLVMIISFRYVGSMGSDHGFFAPIINVDCLLFSSLFIYLLIDYLFIQLFIYSFIYLLKMKQQQHDILIWGGLEKKSESHLGLGFFFRVLLKLIYHLFIICLFLCFRCFPFFLFIYEQIVGRYFYRLLSLLSPFNPTVGHDKLT